MGCLGQRLALARLFEVRGSIGFPAYYRRWQLADGHKGWDEGVMEMSLGEKSILTISGYDVPQPGLESQNMAIGYLEQG